MAIAALAVALVAALAVTPQAGAAAKAKCAKQVIADWYDNGRVDKIYPQRCYREAIKILPVDVRDYSSARDDILRALAYARQGKPDPGDSGTNGDPSGNPSDPGGNPGDPGGNPSDPGGSPVDSSGPSAVPIPLIVLAAIATLLLVLGAAGYFTRRSAGRREDEGPPT